MEYKVGTFPELWVVRQVSIFMQRKGDKMRKIKLDKETILNANLNNDLIEKHAEEKPRIVKMKNYNNGLNEAIINRAYTD